MKFSLVIIADTFITSELLLLFGPLLLNQVARRRFQPNELRFSKHIKHLFTNFIIFGNPTPSNQNTWNPYKSHDYYIENLGSHVENEKSSEILKRVAFWSQLLPKLSQIKNYTNYNFVDLHRSPGSIFNLNKINLTFFLKILQPVTATLFILYWDWL